jgi:hypothetical protein
LDAREATTAPIPRLTSNIGNAQHISVLIEVNNISTPHFLGFFISSATAIPLFGFQHFTTACTFIKILAAIRGHFFLFGSAAFRTGDSAVFFH